MLRSCLVTFFALTSLSAHALEDGLFIEHQLRICDSKKEVLKKLNLHKSDAQVRTLFYVETPDQFYRETGWVIKLKLKKKTVDIDIKRRMKNASPNAEISGIECEYDKHDNSIEKTCSLGSEVALKDFEKIIKEKKSWTGILSSDQKKWLTAHSEIKADARILGTIKDERFEINHETLGVMTVDTAYLASDENVTFYEVSVRYPKQDLNTKGPLFEDFINDTRIGLCADQMDWPVNKYDLMAPLTDL